MRKIFTELLVGFGVGLVMLMSFTMALMSVS